MHDYTEKKLYLFSWHENTVVTLLKPALGVVLGELVWKADLASATSALGNATAGSIENNEKVHTKDSDAWIVFDAEIDVFLDAEAEAAVDREVALFELVLFDFEAGLQDFLGFWSANGYPASDFFITSNTETSDGESRLRENRALAG